MAVVVHAFHVRPPLLPPSCAMLYTLWASISSTHLQCPSCLEWVAALQCHSCSLCLTFISSLLSKITKKRTPWFQNMSDQLNTLCSLFMSPSASPFGHPLYICLSCFIPSRFVTRYSAITVSWTWPMVQCCIEGRTIVGGWWWVDFFIVH